MGCVAERPKFEEEAVLEYSERQLGFSHKSSQQIVQILNGFPDEIGWDQLNAVKDHLHISDVHMSPYQREKFYQYFQKQNQEKGLAVYEKAKFLVMGLILSTDSVQKKANLLFLSGQLSDNKLLQKSSLRSLLSILFTLAIDILPLTLSASVAGRFPSAQIGAYLHRLHAQKESVVQQCMVHILNDREEVRMDSFVLALTETEFGQILSSRGAREMTLGMCSAVWSFKKDG